MENSWYLKRNGLHHFFCKCGTHDFIKVSTEGLFEVIDFKREEIDFTKIPNIYHPDNCCSVCGNEHYLDMNALLFDNKTLYWSDIKWDYEEREDNITWSIVCFVHIPIFNEENETITFRKLQLSTYTIGKHGTHYYTKHSEYFFKNFVNDKRLDGVIKIDISKRILDFILKNPVDTLKWLNGDVKSIDELLFFLEYSNIRSKDIFSWKNKRYFIVALNTYSDVVSFLDYFLHHRKEKSLRKIQFNSYMEMIKLGGYNPLVDYLFSKTINDRNHLLKALGMDTSIKQVLFDHCDKENIYHFIDFLKRHYQEKHIVRFWLSINQDDLNHYLLRDTIQLFSIDTMRIELNEKFQKTPVNLRAIHDELTKHSTRKIKIEREGIVFNYSYIVETQVKQDGISYILPSNYQILYEWGELLHNCLFYYANSIIAKDSIIFGLFVDNSLTYAIEIRNNAIVQVSSAYNQTVTTSEKEKIERWHKNIYLPIAMKMFNK